MARQRMYLFESAYVDYGTRLRRFGRWLLEKCGDIWSWFWSGGGAQLFDVILRLAVVIGAITICVLYVRYEDSKGRGFSIGTVGAILVIFVFTAIVLWSWKAPVHFAARLSAGTSASGLILVLSILSLALATVVFSVYLVVLFTMTVLSLVVFVPMRIAHRLWLLYRRIAYQCPYDDCGARGLLPIHICSCGHEYADLMPSFYGIFHHTCRHNGQEMKLPTMDFLGRNKLPRLCKRCKRPLVLSSIGELSERPIAVVGGPNTGKTIFLRQATRQLADRIGTLPGATVRIDAEVQERVLNQDLAQLDQGRVVAKTAGNEVQAFGLAVRIPKGMHSLLYLYDAPGEHFLTMERFGQKQIIQHLAGIILLADPFSLPALSDYAQRLSVELKPSETPFHDIVAVLIAGVNQMLVRQPTDKCKVPLAVMIAKVDALPVNELPFLANLSPGSGHSADGAFNTRCREALEKLGAGHSIRALEQKFSNVHYFACSALGRMPDLRSSEPFRPVGVTAPFLWLLHLD
jgi:hypothetical protein